MTEVETGTRAERLLVLAQMLQHELWDAMSDLEDELDIEIEQATDLATHSVATLIEDFSK